MSLLGSYVSCETGPGSVFVLRQVSQLRLQRKRCVGKDSRISVTYVSRQAFCCSPSVAPQLVESSTVKYTRSDYPPMTRLRIFPVDPIPAW